VYTYIPNSFNLL